MSTYRENYEFQKKTEAVISLTVLGLANILAIALQYQGMPPHYHALPLIVSICGTLGSVAFFCLTFAESRNQLLSAPDPDSEYTPNQDPEPTLKGTAFGVCVALGIVAVLAFGVSVARHVVLAQDSQDLTVSFHAGQSEGQSIHDFTTTAALFLNRPVAHAVILRKPGLKKSLVCEQKTDGLLSFYEVQTNQDGNLTMQGLSPDEEQTAHLTKVCNAALSAKVK